MDRFTDDRKLGQGFTSADDLVEVDIDNGDKPIKEYKDWFAWDYTEMPTLDRSIVEHRFPIKSGFQPHQQPAR